MAKNAKSFNLSTPGGTYVVPTGRRWIGGCCGTNGTSLTVLVGGQAVCSLSTDGSSGPQRHSPVCAEAGETISLTGTGAVGFSGMLYDI